MFCQPGHFYFRDALAYSPHNYLEIGIFNGDSIGLMGEHYPGKIIFAIDPFLEDGYTSHTSAVTRGEYMPTQKENTLANIKGKDNICLFETTSKDFAEMLTDQMIVDMDVAWVLIDGSHYYEDVVIDYELAMRLIGDKPGGIVFDDAQLPEVNKAHLEFLEKYGNQVSDTLDISGAGYTGHIIAHRINK